MLAAAGRCASLSALSVAMCPRVNDDALIALAASIDAPAAGGGLRGGGSGSRLRELVLDECSAISDAGLLALAGRLRGRLAALSLRRCSKLSDASLVAAAEGGGLARLCINGLHQAGPATLDALGRCCAAQLRELDVSFCPGLTEGSLGRLVERCGELRLRVYGCSQLTGRLLHGHGNDALRVAGVPTSCS